MKKNIFYALMMPAMLLGAVSCTDYQDDIDKLGAENDALRSYNNQTISRLNSVVFQTEEGLNCITVDQPKATTIVYEVEPAVPDIGRDKGVPFYRAGHECGPHAVKLSVSGAVMADPGVGGAKSLCEDLFRTRSLGKGTSAYYLRDGLNRILRRILSGLMASHSVRDKIKARQFSQRYVTGKNKILIHLSSQTFIGYRKRLRHFSLSCIIGLATT